jgi:outer membrane protein assembly factor BamB
MRKIRVNFFAVAVCVALFATNIAALAETVSGKVFLDTNGNGAIDPGENGMGDMMVSDGDAVTKTSASGHYSLTFEITDTRFVFVTIPTGYQLTTLFYIKIEPEGAPKYSMNFGLTPDTNPMNKVGADFNFLAGSDIQYNLVGNEKEFRYDWQTMEDFAKSINIGFATWAGDLTPNGKLVNLQLLREVENTLSYPTYNGFGAHDVKYGIDQWEQALGPYYYSWDYAGRHFITIVSEQYYIEENNEKYGIENGVNARQTRWVLNDLAQMKPGTDVFMVMHTPGEVEPLLNTIASKYNLIGILRGHYHSTYSYRSEKNNIPVLSSAPIRGNDHGVFTKMPRVVHISGKKITTQIFPLGQEKRLITVSPEPEEKLPKSSSVLILANAFNSSSKVTLVKYSLSGPSGPVAKDVPLTKSTWWSWRGKWNASKAPAGEYTLTVIASDDQSQSWQKTIRFTLANEKAPKGKLGVDWPSFFGPDNQNRLTTDSPSGNLQLLWAAPVGSTEKGGVYLSSPLVVDGKVYIGVWDPDYDSVEGGVAVFDAMTGKRLWKLNIGAVYHTPMIYKGRLYALTSEGVVHCIDIVSRKVVWTYDIYSNKDFGPHLATAPVMVANGKVYVVGDYTNAYCLDAAKGSLIWSENVKATTYVISAIYVNNGVAYFMSQYDIYALNADTGKIIYKKSLGYRQRRCGTPLVHNNVLYSAHQSRVGAYDATNGCSETWLITEGGRYKCTMPVFRNGKIYYSDPGATGLIAKKASDGSEVWRFSTKDSELMADNKYQLIWDMSSHALTEKYDYAGSDNGAFYVLDADTGKQVSRYFFGPPVKSSAAISGNMVFIGCTDGNLYAFGPGLE